jgi:hypothetical protein
VANFLDHSSHVLIDLVRVFVGVSLLDAVDGRPEALPGLLAIVVR